MDPQILADELALSLLRGRFQSNFQERKIAVELSYETVNAILSLGHLPSLDAIRTASSDGQAAKAA